MSWINCYDFDTAADSVATAMGLAPALLIGALQEHDESQLLNLVEDPFQKMPKDVLSNFGLNLEAVLAEIQGATYFHATRVAEPDVFATKGILPLGEALESIQTQLKDLAGPSISTSKWNQIWLSLTSHPLPSDAPTLALRMEHRALWGPSGTLVRDAHLHAREIGKSSFLESPEIIVDIANALFERTGVPLPDLFNLATRPYIVEFRSDSIGLNEIRSAIWYIYSSSRSIDLTNIHQGTFDGCGHRVPASDVVSVSVVAS